MYFDNGKFSEQTHQAIYAGK